MVQPKYSINFVLFNSSFVVVEENAGYLPVNDNINAIQILATDLMIMKEAGFLEIFVNNDAKTPVYYDNMRVVMRGGNVMEVNAYYPFGMIIPNLSTWLTYPNEENYYKYNGKELQKDLNLNWLDYGARMYEAEVSRWCVPDPLCEKYYWISPYAYCDNNPIIYIDVLGLTKYLAITMGSDVRYRGQNMALLNSDIEHSRLNNGITGLASILQAASSADPEGIGFIALWSHGIPGEIFEGGNWRSNNISANDLDDLAVSIKNGTINFAAGAIIYLGACNAGTDDNGISFAQKLANITGASVVAARNDKVGPKNETNGNMVYTTYYPSKHQFNWFENGQSSTSVGSEMDVMSLFNRAKNRTNPLKPLKPIPVNSVFRNDNEEDGRDVWSILNSFLMQNPNIKVFSN